MTIPEPWPAVVLALATFRITRLIGWDDLTAPFRGWVVGWSENGDHERQWAFALLSCPWCVGWWVSLLAALGWYASPHWAILVALPFALSAVVGLCARWLDP